jgi:hypothetical protein
MARTPRANRAAHPKPEVRGYERDILEKGEDANLRSGIADQRQFEEECGEARDEQREPHV